MKHVVSFCALLLWGGILIAEVPRSPAEPSSPTPSTSADVPPEKWTYQEFVSRMLSPQHVAEFVARVDRAIDGAERDQVGDSADTSIGLRINFRFAEVEEVILYHVTISRGGAELRYDDAVKLVAFIADRFGLTHPVDVREGEKPIFYAQWLIQGKEWKNMRKKMLEVRAANRSEKDLMKAFAIAIQRELNARSVTKSRRG